MQDDSAASGEFFLKLLAKSASALSPNPLSKPTVSATRVRMGILLAQRMRGSLYALNMFGYSSYNDYMGLYQSHPEPIILEVYGYYHTDGLYF